jgi:UDP-N-acetylglucosamine 4,6-dehydratase/5-epimerase
MLNGQSILITGGTGSFGKTFVKKVFELYDPKKVIIYSRDEYKQYLMQKQFKEYEERLRFFIGDIRDKSRLYRAFDGVDIVVHAAALKQVPAAEYNPIEAVKTNIYGAENVIDAAIDKKVKKVIALSTDKSVNPINLYGATKLVSDKLFVAGNSYVGAQNTHFSVVRYGNVSGSRGSIIPLFKSLIDAKENILPITDFQMTRFWITLDEAVSMVFNAINSSNGGELYVYKCPSFKVTDLAKAMSPNCEFKKIGIRPGEKIHEVMITEDDSRNTYEYRDYYIIYPDWGGWGKVIKIIPNGRKVEKMFRYSSNTNKNWLPIEELKKLLDKIEIEY